MAGSVLTGGAHIPSFVGINISGGPVGARHLLGATPRVVG